ncbi:MAG: tRNA glutamyl-Q(34) synthetase GluQRS [Betaproteobacteria bacterium]
MSAAASPAAAFSIPPTAPARARYRGRFAPSPTGPLHFGSLVAALASYCDARAAQGEWLLRIEDVDLPRSRPGAEGQILSALERHGFAWDGPVTRQSQRTPLYDAALAKLKATGLAYACACSRRELESAPLGVGGERVYPGTCRAGSPLSHHDRRQHAWRVRVGNADVESHDRLQVAQRQSMATDVGDFVLQRADGLFAYQLAVTVDDADQGITDIVRGADLLASTPRQVLLQRLLDLPVPDYLHVPIAINGAGEKLSKQTHAAPLPATPLPTLLAAWDFLGQAPFPERPESVAEFWAWTRETWRVSRVPPVLMLPAPPDMNAGERA